MLEENISFSGIKTYEYKIIHDSFNRVLSNGVWTIEIDDIRDKTAKIYLRSAPSYNTLALSDDLYDFLNNIKDNDEGVWIFKPNEEKEIRSILFIVRMKSDPLKFIIMKLNLYWFLFPILKDVRSGKTGYVWLILSDQLTTHIRF